MTLFALFISVVWSAMGGVFLLHAPADSAALRRFRRASGAFQTAAFAVLVVAVGGSKDSGGQRNVGGFTDEPPPMSATGWTVSGNPSHASSSN